MTYLHYIGIDVSKEWFDVALFKGTKKPSRYSNCSAGFLAFKTEYKAELLEAFVVLEATGGYETALCAALLESHVALHRASGYQTHQYALSLGQKAKTDKADAIVLAHYAAERHAKLTLFALPCKNMDKLSKLLSVREDLVQERVALNNRVQNPNYSETRCFLDPLLAEIATQLARIEAEMTQLIAKDTDLSQKSKILQGIKGIGKQTSLILMGFMPELGTLTRRTAASLAGCAPRTKISGFKTYYSRVIPGRSIIKKCLFMAAMTAVRCDEDMKTFYERLISNGKCKMKALTAVMRKLITIANAKLRDLGKEINAENNSQPTLQHGR